MKLSDHMYAEFWAAYKFMRESQFQTKRCGQCGIEKRDGSYQIDLAQSRLDQIYEKIRQAEHIAELAG